MKRFSWLLLPLLTACGVQGAQIDEQDDDSTEDGRALLGEGANDSADHGCKVVLRSVSRSATGNVFTGTIDATSGTPYVLYKSATATSWKKVKATVANGTRYQFQLTSTAATLQLIPYLATSGGARLFDHNRNAGGFVLSAANGFTIGDDLAVCGAGPMRARLDFTGAWQQLQTGALVAGGHGRINFDLSRLTSCRGTHNGYPAWDLRAFVRFSPGGEQLDGTVRGFNSTNGVPNNANQVPVPFDFDVPAGATSAEVWFLNSDGAGDSCTAYDSNFGANYRFTVEQAAPSAVQWTGDVGSSFSRDCTHRDGVADPVVFDDYIYERACSFVEVDVYVPGLTDGATAHPEYLWAFTDQTLDGANLAPVAMTFQGRVGNNYRFRYELPRQDLFYAPKWSALLYTPRFSTDGVSFVSQPGRSVTRDPTFCNPAWNGCN